MSACQRTNDNIVDLFVAEPAPPVASPKGIKICRVIYNDMRAWPEWPVKQEAEYQAHHRSSVGKPQAAPDLAALAAHAKAIENMLAEFEACCAAEQPEN
jgi:hypothetical protein